MKRIEARVGIDWMSVASWGVREPGALESKPERIGFDITSSGSGQRPTPRGVLGSLSHSCREAKSIRSWRAKSIFSQLLHSSIALHSCSSSFPSVPGPPVFSLSAGSTLILVAQSPRHGRADSDLRTSGNPFPFWRLSSSPGAAQSNIQ